VFIVPHFRIRSCNLKVLSFPRFVLDRTPSTFVPWTKDQLGLKPIWWISVGFKPLAHSGSVRVLIKDSGWCPQEPWFRAEINSAEIRDPTHENIELIYLPLLLQIVIPLILIIGSTFLETYRNIWGLLDWIRELMILESLPMEDLLPTQDGAVWFHPIY
jgi:hypothetical protein